MKMHPHIYSYPLKKQKLAVTSYVSLARHSDHLQGTGDDSVPGKQHTEDPELPGGPGRCPVNTCAEGCPPKGMALDGTADTAVVGGNRALTCIPPWVKAAVIILRTEGQQTR